MVVQGPQSVGDEVRSACLLESQLGVLVNVASGGDERCAIYWTEGAHTSELGQSRLSTQSAQRGRRAMQTVRPC